MSVFDSATKVRRMTADSQTDKRLPQSRNLSLAQIADDSALAGTAGVHCELIHGDEWQQTGGTHHEYIMGHQHCVTGSNQTIRINGKHKETILQTCYQNIVGPHTVVNHTVRNETRMGKRTTTYGIHTIEDDHDGRMEYADGIYEIVGVSNVEVAATKLTVQVLHVEPKAIHVYASLVQPFAPILDVQEKLHKMKENVWLSKLTGLHGAISILKDDVGLLNSQLNSGVLVPVDANGTVLW